MMKKILFPVLIVVLLAGIASAHENFAETKRLIDTGISCDKLSEEQLEEMGDYYMEQMHPGEAHELMHKMMGGGDSQIVKQMHTNMAKSIYCGEGGMMSSVGMMGMMNMMGGGMMSGQNVQGSMMGGWEYGFGYWNVINILYAILLIGLIILVYLWIMNLWKNKKGGCGKR